MQQCQLNHYSLELTFKFRWYLFIIQSSKEMPPLHPHRTNNMWAILVDIPMAHTLDYKPKVLEFISLGNICVKPQFNAFPMQRLTEFALNMLCLGPAQPEPFSLQIWLCTSSLALTQLGISSITTMFENNIHLSTSS